MLDLTKSLKTGGYTEFCLRVPGPYTGAVEKALEGIQALLNESGDIYNDKGERLEVIPPVAPGQVLYGFRMYAELSQDGLAAELAKLGSNVKQQHVSEMESGNRAISKKMAHNLAIIFNTTHKTFL